MFFRALAVLTALLGPACSVPNQSHCGNLDGDATCVARDPGRPHCSLCEAVNDGCVAEPVTEERCHLASDSGAAGSTAAPTTSTGPTTGAPATTGTTGVTGTSTGTTGTSTTGTSTTTTTTATTEMSSGTASSTTDGGPVCGDGKAEGAENCDLDDLGGKKCSDFAPPYGGGTLVCNATCDFDFAGCCKLAGQSCVMNGECCGNNCFLLSCK